MSATHPTTHKLSQAGSLKQPILCKLKNLKVVGVFKSDPVSGKCQTLACAGNRQLGLQILYQAVDISGVGNCQKGPIYGEANRQLGLHILYQAAPLSSAHIVENVSNVLMCRKYFLMT